MAPPRLSWLHNFVQSFSLSFSNESLSEPLPPPSLTLFAALALPNTSCLTLVSLLSCEPILLRLRCKIYWHRGLESFLPHHEIYVDDDLIVIQRHRLKVSHPCQSSKLEWNLALYTVSSCGS
ncbi:unnamed protein product [Linum trigynum]|uniref:Uncharacterized protein n=1 Tax=Linum trigynum TaxID=586398 RepID=A0AAV2G7T1_9ROSI